MVESGLSLLTGAYFWGRAYKHPEKITLGLIFRLCLIWGNWVKMLLQWLLILRTWSLEHMRVVSYIVVYTDNSGRECTPGDSTLN